MTTLPTVRAQVLLPRIVPGTGDLEMERMPLSHPGTVTQTLNFLRVVMKVPQGVAGTPIGTFHED